MASFDNVRFHSYLYHDFSFTLLSYFSITICLSIQVYITCTIYDLGGLRVAQNLQVDELFITSS